MSLTKPAMKMPELLVFVRLFAVGFVVAEICRATFHLSGSFVQELIDVSLWAKVMVILAALVLCLTYAIKRGAFMVAAQMGRSLRLDLLTAMGVGVWSNELALPWFSKFHAALKSGDPHWAPVIFILLCVVLLSPLLQKYWPRPKKMPSPLFFIADEEIGEEKDDLLACEGQAKSFAETVLASGAHPGLVFGVDGPWGIGKTSFINLAERYWERATDKVIVCRFEPLRYATEPDLSDRLIRDLSAAIQSKVFAPEFRPAASRYDQFWRVLVNQSHQFTSALAQDSIETLVEFLPRYSAFENEDRGLRQRSIYSLLRLLDRAGWGRTLERRLPNSAEHVIEIAWRIFGERTYQGKGLLERLASPVRGVLGWNDLMLFRLQCSADRQGQLYNLHTALIVHQDKTAATSGLVSELALLGMRKLSQDVFALFKRAYIDSRRNFLAEADEAPAGVFLGVAFAKLGAQMSSSPQSEHGDATTFRRLASAQSAVKSFVIYQLSNSLPPSGSGVGCGYYDENGVEDGGGIAKLMNEYVFGTCFNPDLDDNNALLFLDHCLSHLSSSFFTGRDERGYSATKAELPGGLDPKEMGRYWRQYRVQIQVRKLETIQRCVFTPNYIASYGDDLKGVFAVLDELADETSPVLAVPNEIQSTTS